MKQIRGKIYRDFSKGTWGSIQSSLAPTNSFKLGLNLDSDNEMGSLVSRNGTTLIGSQLVDNKPILGLHDFRDSVGSGSKLFAVVSDGTNSDIYDVVAGTKSLEDDTKDLKTRFLTYLDSCLRLNGTDQPKAWNGAAWVDTAGTFDLDNMPQTAKYAIEFKDRVYVAGMAADPDRVDYSGIADSDDRDVSWTDDNGFIVFEQEDGGGGIMGLAKVPGYILIFKKRTLKRYDGISAYPEDMINQGAPSQEAIVTAQGMALWVNENGAWATTGGVPQKISTFTVDKIIKSCSATNLLNVAAGTDEEHVYWSFASVTIDGETYTNVVLKFNILQNSWDVRKYATLPRVFTKYVDSTGAVFTVFGDDDGNVQKLDTGNTDNGIPITYSLETQDLDFGSRLFKKSINRFGVFTDNISNATVLWRDSSQPEDWKPIGTISSDITDLDGLNIEANYYNFKITSSVDSGQVKILGFEFPDGIKLYDNSTT